MGVRGEEVRAACRSPPLPGWRAEDGLRVSHWLLQHVHAQVHTHRHTRASARRPAQPRSPREQHFLQTHKAILDTLRPISSPGSPRSPASRLTYLHSAECCLTVKQLRRQGHGREPCTILLRLRGKQGKPAHDRMTPTCPRWARWELMQELHRWRARRAVSTGSGRHRTSLQDPSGIIR